MKTFRRLVPAAVLVSLCICVDEVARAAEPDRAALSAKLKEAARLQKQVHEIYKKLHPLSRQIVKAFKTYLPAEDGPYGKYERKCYGSASLICVDIIKKPKTRLVWIHVLYRPTIGEGERKSFRTTFLGMPAKNVGKGVWFLAGNMELRVVPSHKSFHGRGKLEALMKAFNLEAIKGL